MRNEHLQVSNRVIYASPKSRSLVSALPHRRSQIVDGTWCSGLDDDVDGVPTVELAVGMHITLDCAPIQPWHGMRIRT